MRDGIFLFILVVVAVVAVVVSVVDGVPLSSVTGSSVAVEKKVGDTQQSSNIHSVPIDNPLVVKAAQVTLFLISLLFLAICCYSLLFRAKSCIVFFLTHSML